MSFTVYGAAGSGSVPVEAALTLLGIDHEVVEARPGRARRNGIGWPRSIPCARSRP